MYAQKVLQNSATISHQLFTVIFVSASYGQSEFKCLSPTSMEEIYNYSYWLVTLKNVSVYLFPVNKTLSLPTIDQSKLFLGLNCAKRDQTYKKSIPPFI